MALTETNAQYYSGQQIVEITSTTNIVKFSFDTDLVSAYDENANIISYVKIIILLFNFI